TPPGGPFARSSGGTEFLLSSLDFFGALDNRLAVWALTNTSSLNSSSPSLELLHVVIHSETYGQPTSNASQKDGNIPFGHLNGATHAGLIAVNDDRMNQVVFADGKLWSGVNTAFADGRTGIAWFAVEAEQEHGQLSAHMEEQGYIN